MSFASTGSLRRQSSRRQSSRRQSKRGSIFSSPGQANLAKDEKREVDMEKLDTVSRDARVVIRCSDPCRVAGVEWPSAVYLESRPLHGPLKTLYFVAKASDQGWGSTGDSQLYLEVFDPISGEKVHRNSFVLTHNLREIRRVFDIEDDLVKFSGLGLALRLVMVSAPWPGWSCCVTKCSFTYECDRNPDNMELRQAFIKALSEEQSGQWRRSKLMVIGQGRAGKSATVRSLLGKPFDDNLESTVGAQLTQSVVRSSPSSEGTWQAVERADGQDFTGEIAEKIAKSAVNLNRISRRLSSRRLSSRRQSVLRQSSRRLSARKSSKGHSSRLSMMTNPRVSGQVRRSIRKILGEREDEREEPIDIEKIQEQEKLIQAELSSLSKDDLPRIRRMENSFELSGGISENSISFTIWDYGGQTVFQTLHHLFLTKYGVYLLVVDMREVANSSREALEYIHFWLVSVAMYAADAPLLTIGTHLDAMETREDLLKVDEVLSPQLNQFVSGSVVKNTREELSFFPLNNVNSDGIEDIRIAIEESAERQEYVNNEVPLRWMKLMDKVLALDLTHISLNRVAAIRDEMWEDPSNTEDFDAMLRMFHELGVIVHLTSTEALSGTITLNPQWLIDNVTKPIRDRKLHPFSRLEREQLREMDLLSDVGRLFDEGIVSIDLLEFFWSKEQTAFFLDFMKHTMLISVWPWTDEEMFLLPSMICAQDHDGPNSGFECMHAALEFPNGLPTGVFERMVCMLISQASSEEAQEPILSQKAASIWLTSEDVVELNQHKDKIMLFSLPQVAPRALDVVQSIFVKLKSDIFGPAFKLQIKVEGKGKFWELEEARERTDCKGWFRPEPMQTSLLTPDFVL